MRSDNMPRPFAPEHGDESASQLQCDIERIDAIFEVYGLRLHAEAWQRLKPRLTPDRGRVARAIYNNNRSPMFDPQWDDLPEGSKESLLRDADAAIAAMGETK